MRRITNEEVAIRLSVGDTYEEIATALSTSRQSVSKRAKEEDVRSLVLQYRRRMVDTAIGRGSRAVRRAMETLDEYLSPGPAAQRGASVCISAANSIIDQLRNLRKDIELAEEVSRMRAQLNALLAERNKEADRPLDETWPQVPSDPLPAEVTDVQGEAE